MSQKYLNAAKQSYELYVPECRTYLDLRSASPDREFYNVELVRSFIEKNPGFTLKEIVLSLGLHQRTVVKAIRIIRGQARITDHAANRRR